MQRVSLASYNKVVYMCLQIVRRAKPEHLEAAENIKAIVESWQREQEQIAPSLSSKSSTSSSKGAKEGGKKTDRPPLNRRERRALKWKQLQEKRSSLPKR